MRLLAFALTPYNKTNLGDTELYTAPADLLDCIDEHFKAGTSEEVHGRLLIQAS